MDGSKAKLLLATAVFSSIASLLGWVTGVLTGSCGSVAYWLLGASLVLGVASTVLWVRQFAYEQRLARRYFEALNRLGPHSMASDTPITEAPPLSSDNPWFGIANRFKETFQAHCQRLQHAEHARASLEVRLRRSSSRQQQVERVLSAIAEPILAVNDYEEVVLANASAEALLDLQLPDVGERALAQLVHCEELVELLTETRRRKAPSQRTGEVELLDREGQAHWYSVTARSVPFTEGTDEAGVQLGAVAILRDISEFKASQRKNADFVSAVSHEMKTPLAGIKAYVELLVDGDAEDQQTREEFLNVINSQANRLQRLIDNLLNLARIEAGVVNVCKQSRSLNELLEEALHIVRPAAEAKQIELAADLSGMYLGVLVDRDMLLQTAINLLSNAIKYTHEGGKVTLRSRLADDRVQFEVEDSGVGLGPEDCERIFEKFYRVKKDSDMASGTGLGLPLAKHIVEDVHGGRLSVRSVLGLGSTFTVTLPALRR